MLPRSVNVKPTAARGNHSLIVSMQYVSNAKACKTKVSSGPA